jgi:tetratricopeptide (TPR) repeat protein
METLNKHLDTALMLVHGGRAPTEQELQRHREKVKVLDSEIRKQPDNAWLYFARAIEASYMLDYDRVLTDVNRAIELDPDEPFFHYLRMQAKVCRMDEAYAEIPLNMQNAQEVKWQSENLRIDVMSALDDCERFRSFDPSFFGIWYNRGNLFAKMKQWKEAVQEYTEAIRLNKDYAEAYYNRGVAYLMMGEHVKGVADLSKAGELGLYKAYNLIKRYRMPSAE